MKLRLWPFVSFLFVLPLALWGRAPIPAPAGALALQPIQAPVLKWQHGGCFTSWCETGWYASPAVADLNGDGRPEVIASAYSIVVLDGPTGNVKWRLKSGHDRTQPEADNVGRTWPGVVVADVDGDGDLEIVTAHGGGYVSVYNHFGYFAPGWPQRPATDELRGLAVHDLDGDGDLEIVVSAAVGSKVNTWVYEHDGTLRPGWPQLSGTTGYAAGVYNDNAAVGDLDGDDLGEIVVPSDVHYICAYYADGSQVAADAATYGGKTWGEVGVWESLATELRGWGYCDGVREESYRTNFAHGPAVLADVDGDGSTEVVATGNVYDCSVGHPPGKYNGVYLFNADRTRFAGSGYDWSAPPVDTGGPLTEDYGIIENNQPNPAVADLDGDGEQEILYASYDGRVHTFWLDGTEHGSWPYAVYEG
ncbi:MAG: FG-GAP repeat domain-containing protein, partial [Anaerolineae bacterium]